MSAVWMSPVRSALLGFPTLAAMAVGVLMVPAEAVVRASTPIAQNQDDKKGDSKKARHALVDEMFNSSVKVEIDGIQMTVEGLDEKTTRHLAGLMSTLRAAMFAETQNDLFDGGRQIRVRLRSQQAPNHYCGGKSAVTLVVPHPSFVIGGHGYDIAWTFLQVAMETQWTRIVRPVWSMPAVVRDAISRVLIERYLPTIIEEHGEQWWIGEEVPTGYPWGLSRDSSYVRQRDRVCARLRAFIDKQGFEAMISAINHWNMLRLTGEAATTHLTDVVSAAFDEAEPAPLLPAVEFATREPWAGIDGDRLQGILFRRTSKAVHYWAGQREGIPEQFISAKGGAPTLALRIPAVGLWKYERSEIVLRRVGEFEPDQQFFVVLLDRFGHELFRWGYLLHQLPEEADWLILENSAKPQMPEEFFVSFEFPPMAEGQDVEVGVWPGAKAEHCFRSAAGERISSLSEPLDIGCVVHIGVAQVNPRRVKQSIVTALQGK